jgi:predicted transcriptional regulator
MSKREYLSLEMECLMLFQSNPYLFETIQGLEKRLGRKKSDLEPILERLTMQGILQKTGDGSLGYFRYKEPAVIAEFSFTSELETL